jgi:hypothetical protein
LVDALVLGTSAFGMGVRVPPLAPFSLDYEALTTDSCQAIKDLIVKIAFQMVM